MSPQLDRINLFWRAPPPTTANNDRHKRNDMMSDKSPEKGKRRPTNR